MTVTLYTTESCRKCDLTKKQFDRKNVSYEIINCTDNDEARNFVNDLGYFGAPVVVVEDSEGNVTHWNDFRPDRINDLASQFATV